MVLSKYIRILSLVVIIGFLCGSNVFAQSSYTWTGAAGNGNWSWSTSNWNGGNPGNAQAILHFAGSTQLSSTNNFSAFGPGFEILFDAGASSFTLSGNGINFYDYSGASPKIENNSSNLQTITFQVDSEGTGSTNSIPLQIVAVNGNMAFTTGNVYIDYGTGVTLSANAGKTITFNDTINNGNATGAVTIGTSIDSSNGTGTVIFAGANGYTGATTINAGTLQLGNGGLTGSISSSSAVTLATGATLAISETGGPTISNAITIGSTGTSNITVASGDSANFSGAIITATSGTLSVAGGTVTLSGGGDNTNLGVVVTSGTLILSKTTSGAHAVGTTLTINSGATTQLAGSTGDQIYDHATVTNNGVFDMNSKSESFDQLTGSGTVTNTSASSTSTLTLGANNGSNTFGGAINNGSGTVALVQSGTGMLTLTGSSNYGGGTTITAGAINIQNANALGAQSGTVGVAAGATLQLQGGITTGTNLLTLSGTGSVNGALDNLSGNNTYSGSMTLSSTATVSSESGTLTLNGGISEGANRLTVTGAGNVTITGNGITGSGGDVLKQGAGTLTLNTSSSYAGSTGGTNNVYMDQGTINVAVNNALGTTNGTTTGAVNMGSSVAAGLNTVLNISGTGVTVANPINVRFLQTGGKTIASTAISGTDTYSGAISLADNVTLNAGTGSTLLFTGIISQAAGVLGTTAGSGTVNSTAPTGGFNTSGSNGPGVIINGTTGVGVSGVVEYDNAMTYTGDTVVNSGTLQFNGAGSLANSSIRLGNDGAATLNLISPTGSTLNVTVNVRPSTGTKVISASNTSGTSTLGGHFALDDNATVIETSPTGTLSITQLRATPTDTVTATDIKGYTLTLTPAGTINYAGTIYSSTGTGNIVMNGTGLLNISGSNTYAGTTTVNSGKLAVTNTNGSATGSGTVSITPGASGIATLSGNGTIGGAVITSATSATVGVAHIAPGMNVSGANNNFGTAATLNLGGGLTIGAGTNLDFDLGTSSDLIAVTGALSLGSNVVLNVNQASGFAANTVYTLLTYTGSLTGGTSGWTTTGGPAGANVVFTAASGAVTVDFVTNNSALAVTPSPISLGNVLLGHTPASVSGTITNNGTTGTGTYTLVATGSASASGSGTLAASGGATAFTISTTGTLGGNSGNNVVVGTVGASNSANPSGSATPVNVTANLYQTALLTPTVSGTNLNLKNAASTDGGQRAGVTVSNFSASNANFVVTTANGGAVGTATATDVTTTVATVGVSSNRLSGTYTYTGSVTGSAAYTDATLAGQGTVANQTWSGISITGTVTGATSSGTAQVRQAFVANGTSYTGYGLTSAVSGGKGQPSNPTVAQIIASNNASGDTTVDMNFSLNGGHPVSAFQASDTLTLSGIHARAGGGNGPDGGSILTDTFVLQMSYVTNPNDTGYYIGWWDPAFNSNVGGWVNAIAGNSNAVLPRDYVGTGGYQESYSAYLAGAGNGLTLDQQLGAYGYDSSTDTAWAVLDHNSDFEVIPEPGTYAMIFSGFGMLCVWHRSRRRKTKAQ